MTNLPPPLTMTAIMGTSAQHSQVKLTVNDDTFKIGHNYTVESWIYTDSISPSGIPLITREKTTDHAGFYLSYNYGKVIFEVFHTSNVRAEERVFNLKPESWNHFAVHAQSWGTYLVYVNGILVIEINNFVGPPVQTMNGTPIIFYPSETQHLGEVAIWSSARTDFEIFQDMFSIPESDPFLAAYYDFTSYPPSLNAKSQYELSEGAEFVHLQPGLLKTPTGTLVTPLDNPALAPGMNGTPFTIEAWVCIEEENDWGKSILQHSWGTNGLHIIIYGAAIWVGWNDSPDNGGGFSTAPVLSPENWYDIAITWDGRSKFAVFVNGEAVAITSYEHNGESDENTPPASPSWSGGTSTKFQLAADATQSNSGSYLIQYMTLWNRVLSPDAIKELMYNDPSDITGLVANFDFSMPPPEEWASPDKIFFENANIATRRVSIPAGASSAPEARKSRARSSAPAPAIDRKRTADNSVPELDSVAFTDEMRAQWRDAVIKALPPGTDDAKRKRLLDTLEENFNAAPDRKRTAHAHITRRMEDGHHILTHHTSDGPTDIMRISSEEFDPCTVAIIELATVISIGLIGLVIGLEADGVKIGHLLLELFAFEAARGAMTTALGAGFTPNSVIDMLVILYEHNFLRKFVLTCILSVSLWMLIRVVAKLAGIASGLGVADFLVHLAILVAETVEAGIEVNHACHS